MMRLPPGKNLAVNEPTEICPGCQREGGSVIMEHFPGLWHWRCGLKAEYIRQAAERGHFLTNVPERVMAKMEKLYKKGLIKAMRRFLGRD